MTKKEKEKALKEVDRQHEEKKTVADPEELWEKILHLSELMEVDKVFRTESDYDREEPHTEIWEKHSDIRSDIWRQFSHLWLNGVKPHLTIKGAGKYDFPGPIEEADPETSNSESEDIQKLNVIINTQTDKIQNFGKKLETDLGIIKKEINKTHYLFELWESRAIGDKAFIVEFKEVMEEKVAAAYRTLGWEIEALIAFGKGKEEDDFNEETPF